MQKTIYSTTRWSLEYITHRDQVTNPLFLWQISQNQATAQNGTNSHGSKGGGNAAAGGAAGGANAAGAGGGKAESNNGVTSLGQVSKQVVPGPTSASHVVIDEKKNKKKGCCVVQ